MIAPLRGPQVSVKQELATKEIGTSEYFTSAVDNTEESCNP